MCDNAKSNPSTVPYHEKGKAAELWNQCATEGSLTPTPSWWRRTLEERVWATERELTQLRALLRALPEELPNDAALAMNTLVALW
jgi:hypothetical protein